MWVFVCVSSEARSWFGLALRLVQSDNSDVCPGGLHYSSRGEPAHIHVCLHVCVCVCMFVHELVFVHVPVHHCWLGMQGML